MSKTLSQELGPPNCHECEAEGQACSFEQWASDKRLVIGIIAEFALGLKTLEWVFEVLEDASIEEKHAILKASAKS